MRSPIKIFTRPLSKRGEGACAPFFLNHNRKHTFNMGEGTLLGSALVKHFVFMLMSTKASSPQPCLVVVEVCR